MNKDFPMELVTVYGSAHGAGKTQHTEELYKMLCDKVLEAMDVMARNHAIPKTIYLTPFAFNIILAHAKERPMFMGLDVRVADLKPGTLFYLGQEEDE